MIRGDPKLPPATLGRAARPLTPGFSVLLVHGALQHAIPTLPYHAQSMARPCLRRLQCLPRPLS